jgi:L-cystine transport system permease protein
LPVFIGKIPFTLGIIFLSFSLGFLLAFLITLGRINRIPVLSQLLDGYVSFIRCIPSVLLLFLVYYGLPYIADALFHVRLEDVQKITFGVISLALFNGGWISEILRASMQTIGREQSELADSLGYSYFLKLFRVILPQALLIALPDLGNAVINIMKDTALFFTIGIVDMMGLAEIVIANHYGVKQAEIYIAVGIAYWICSVILTLIIKYFERRGRKSRMAKGLLGAQGAS